MPELRTQPITLILDGVGLSTDKTKDKLLESVNLLINEREYNAKDK